MHYWAAPPWPNAGRASTKNSDAAPPVRRLCRYQAIPADHDAVRITIAGGGHEGSVEREQILAPPRGNGHDNKAEVLEIPAFLRRG